MTRALAVALLIVLVPLFAVLALVVRIGLGSPVLFRQTRSGLAGRPFTMLKFRSMNEERDARGELLPDAGRTPPVGRFLRRSRLDELPELLNIARGQMAFVGPRPLLPRTVANMGDGGQIRGRVRPGLTGLAQVSGNTLLTGEEKLALDVCYVRHRTPVLDLKILLRTALVVVAGERKSHWYDPASRRSRRGC